MKKVFIVGVLIFCATAVWADPVDRELPKTATQQVKNSTRQMVNQGFNTDNVIDMTRRMLANNFKQQQILQAHSILMNARQQGLQTVPIMNKAYEGLAKQVRSEAVVQAMEQVRSRYEFAARQAKAFTKDRAKMNQMETILAGSLAAGMNHEDAERIMLVLHERTRNMTRTHAEALAMQTFITTRTMARLGVESQSVSDTVCQALQQGYSAQEMDGMRNTMMTNTDHTFSRGMDMGQDPNGQHEGQSGMGGMGGGSGGGMGGGHM